MVSDGSELVSETLDVVTFVAPVAFIVGQLGAVLVEDVALDDVELTSEVDELDEVVVEDEVGGLVVAVVEELLLVEPATAT